MADCVYDPSRLKMILDLVIESRRDLIGSVVDQMMAAIKKMPCAEGHFDEIEVALAEALSNAIVHGNREDPAKRVRVSAACADNEQLLIAVTDEGEGFDCKNLPDPTIAENVFSVHGRGIFLIRHLMDEAEHRLGGRQIVMRKRVRSAD